ncbi:MAG: hypothetical protein K6G03_02200 [Lachnospiraceae bacterium]|nr:hypothetical protein [Lachnospiraceae bacterium]
MEEVRRAIRDMKSFLLLSIPKIPVDKKGKVDIKAEKKARKEIDALNIISVMKYNSLNEGLKKCEKRFEVSKPQLAGMITALKEKNEKDSAIFREKALEYREFARLDPQYRSKNLTLIGALKNTRSDFYDLDSGDFIVKSDGAGASQLLSIERKVSEKDKKAGGSGRVFFREEDEVLSLDINSHVENSLSKFGMTDEKVKDIKTNIYEFSQDKAGFKAARRKIQELKINNKSLLSIGDEMNKIIPGMSELFKKANKATRTKLGELYVDFFSSYTQAYIASSDENRYAKIREGRPLSNRNVATSRLANLLGIGDLICDSRLAVIKKDKKKISGNIMEETGGKAIALIRGKSDNDTLPATCTYADSVIPQLYSMQVFDLICGQIDRHARNFHGIPKNGKIVQIRGLDNDMSFGDLNFADVVNGRNRIRPLNDQALLGMPKALATNIMAMTPEYLYNTLGDILDETEIKCLWNRFEGVKEKIRNIGSEDDHKYAKWENGELIYSKKEDNDDILRALKMLKEQKKKFDDDNKKIRKENLKLPEGQKKGRLRFHRSTMFFETTLDFFDMNNAIKERRNKINNNRNVR